MPPDNCNNWSKHVLTELERLKECVLSIQEEVIQTRIELAKLKVRAGIWGAVGAMIPVVIGTAIAIAVFFHGH